MAKKLEGPAKKKAESLGKLLQQDDANPQLVEQRYGALCGMIGPRFGDYRAQVMTILGRAQVTRLTEMLSLEL